MQRNVRVVFDPQTFDSSANDKVKKDPLLGNFLDSASKNDGSIPVLHIALRGDDHDPDIEFSLGGQTVSMKASEYLTAIETQYANQHDFIAQHSGEIKTLSQNFQEEGMPSHGGVTLVALEKQARAGHLARCLSPLMEAEDFYFFGLSGALHDALPQDLKEGIAEDMVNRFTENLDQSNHCE